MPPICPNCELHHLVIWGHGIPAYCTECGYEDTLQWHEKKRHYAKVREGLLKHATLTAAGATDLEASVSLITGLSVDRIRELGGVPEPERR